jgi:hypothetical protein
MAVLARERFLKKSHVALCRSFVTIPKPPVVKVRYQLLLLARRSVDVFFVHKQDWLSWLRECGRIGTGGPPFAVDA